MKIEIDVNVNFRNASTDKFIYESLVKLLKYGERTMAAIDDIEAATTAIGDSLTAIAQDIQDIKAGNPADQQRLTDAATKLQTIAAAAKALDEENPTIPTPLP